MIPSDRQVFTTQGELGKSGKFLTLFDSKNEYDFADFGHHNLASLTKSDNIQI